MEVQYDSSGRMKYNPEYHFNHKKPYTVQELIYICTTYRRGTRKQVAFAVGRTESTIATLINKLKQNGEFERYKRMSM